MSAVEELVKRAGQAAQMLSQAGQHKAAAELAEQAGAVRYESGHREGRLWLLSEYHERQAKRCSDGLARKYHLDAVSFLRGEL